ncbi:hypothetical protein ABZ611_14510 [Streptomyces sp. NPDC007861]|uniref:hypothetical protein n=1 Tax=Streptomyces sp. NPDC007861 TaxID=3154893 RepID=UPI00340966DE
MPVRLRVSRTSPPASATSGHTVTSAADWLSTALCEPEHATRQWALQGVALLPLGVVFSAVRLADEIVHAAADSDCPAVVADVLAEGVDGPVIHDPRGRRYYALVEPGAAPGRFPRSCGVDWLGRGSHLCVPDADRTEYAPPTRTPYWAVPIESAGDLCEQSAVAWMARIGRARLDEAAVAGPAG